jgi:hypothetical protein
MGKCHTCAMVNTGGFSVTRVKRRCSGTVYGGPAGCPGRGFTDHGIGQDRCSGPPQTAARDVWPRIRAAAARATSGAAALCDCQGHACAFNVLCFAPAPPRLHRLVWHSAAPPGGNTLPPLFPPAQLVDSFDRPFCCARLKQPVPWVPVAVGVPCCCWPSRCCCAPGCRLWRAPASWAATWRKCRLLFAQ